MQADGADDLQHAWDLSESEARALRSRLAGRVERPEHAPVLWQH